MNPDSYHDMLAAVQSFHDKHNFKAQGGEELAYRVALMAEELGRDFRVRHQGQAQGGAGGRSGGSVYPDTRHRH